MWEQWRAEIDRVVREAELDRDIWSDREFRAELRDDVSASLSRPAARLRERDDESVLLDAEMTLEAGRTT